MSLVSVKGEANGSKTYTLRQIAQFQHDLPENIELVLDSGKTLSLTPEMATKMSASLSALLTLEMICTGDVDVLSLQLSPVSFEMNTKTREILNLLKQRDERSILQSTPNKTCSGAQAQR